MKYKPYSEYRDSGVEWLGEIPAHWESLALKRIVDPARPVTYGIVQCGPDYPEGVPYIRPVDMGDEGGVRVEALRQTAPEIAAAYARSAVRPNDVVVSIGPSFGKTMIVPPELDGANLTQGTARVAPGRRVTSRFLFWALRGESSRQAWDSYCAGATFRALTLEILETCAVALPSTDEQRNIAAFLDRETSKIDVLVAKKERLIELLQEKRTALITRAVTKGLDPSVPMKGSGVDWLGEIPACWEMIRLGRKIVLQRGEDITKDEQIDGVVPVVSSGGVSSFHDKPFAAGPGVVVGRKGTAGAVYYVEPAFWPHDTTLWVREFRGSHPRYVFYKLCAMDLASFDTGSANPTLNRNLIHPVVVSWPPVGEQRDIAAFLDRETSQIDALVAKVRDASDRLRELRTAVVSAAVTGKIDVRDRPRW